MSERAGRAPDVRRGIGGAGWLALFWAVGLTLFAASALYLGQPLPPVPGGRLAGAAVRGAVSATFWAVTSAACFGVGVLAPGRLGGTGLRCVVASLVTTVLFTIQARTYCGLGWMKCGNPVASVLVTLPMVVMLSAGLAVAGRAFARAARHREAEVREERLAAALAGARLDALGVQLRPHFLFNTLQSVATLMHRDASAARRMLGGLATLLERSTLAAEAQEVALSEELELLRLYTEIETVRFGERLRVDLSIEPGTERVLVPHLLLQPLVENAIRHAVARRGEGRIEVRSEAKGSPPFLVLEVRDNGTGLAPGWRERAEGVGLANTRARLGALYGASHRFELDSRPGEGLTVRISLPLRNAERGSGDA
jgi:two-component sensor histidine kinase